MSCVCWRCAVSQANALNALRAQQQQLQQDLVETAELRVKVSRMQEVVADLPALQEELQQLQAAHEASLEQSRQLQAKVCLKGVCSCIGCLCFVHCSGAGSGHLATANFFLMSDITRHHC